MLQLTFNMVSNRNYKLYFKQDKIFYRNEIHKLEIETMLNPCINNDSRLIIIRTLASNLSHVKDNTIYKDHIQAEISRLINKVISISFREMT